MTRRLLSLVMLAAGLVQAQAGGENLEDLRAGRFLVASRKLADPNFAETVILLLQYDENGSMGLVINRPSRVSVSQVFKEIPSARRRSEAAYSGGPVERDGARVLLRTKTKPEDSRFVLRGVYLLGGNKQLADALTAGVRPEELRVYLGYAGWGAGQLEMETEVGAWHILRADAGSVFDPQPDSLWSRLIAETERSIAGLFLPTWAPVWDRSSRLDSPGRHLPR